MPRWGFWARFKAQRKRDLKKAKAHRLSWQVMLCGIVCVALICLLLYQFSGPNLMLPAVVTLASFPYVVWFKWELRQEVWFQIVTLAMLTVHGILLFYIPWTYRDMPGRAVGGAAVLDICLMLAMVNAVGVLVAGKKKVVALHETEG